MSKVILVWVQEKWVSGWVHGQLIKRIDERVSELKGQQNITGFMIIFGSVSVRLTFSSLCITVDQRFKLLVSCVSNLCTVLVFAMTMGARCAALLRGESPVLVARRNKTAHQSDTLLLLCRSTFLARCHWRGSCQKQRSWDRKQQKSTRKSDDTAARLRISVLKLRRTGCRLFEDRNSCANLALSVSEVKF